MYAAEADLAEYGRYEHELFRELGGQRILGYKDLKFGSRLLCRDYLPLRIINFTYGPKVEDWEIWVSNPLDEWAGEFWYWVENPELFAPGAWLDSLDEVPFEHWPREHEKRRRRKKVGSQVMNDMRGRSMRF